MSKATLTTRELAGMRVIDAASGKRIGKVRHFVFHPSERRVVGFTVRRPDAAMMFHRKDLFVALNGFDVEDGCVAVRGSAPVAGRSAVKTLGVSWDECVIWIGMPVVTTEGNALGYVGDVAFDRATGAVEQVSVDTGVANDALLGKGVIPGALVKGFKGGRGETSISTGEGSDEASAVPAHEGAILVSAEAAGIAREGGAAAAAGKATAVAADKAKRGAAKARVVVGERVQKAKPAAAATAKKAEEAVETGSFAVGRQIGKTAGMFSAFKEEFKKAANESEEDE